MAGMSNIPGIPHIALITTSSRSFYTPGDERSRLNPGHGYPERTETVESLEYEVFYKIDMKKLEARIIQLQRFNKPFKVMSVEPMKVETTIKVSVG